MGIDGCVELSESIKGEIVKVETKQGDDLIGLWKSNQLNDRNGEVRMVIEIEDKHVFINCNRILTI